MLRLMVSGVNCETDINECNYDPPVCKNGGVCTNLPGRHSCSCTTQTEAGELITGIAMVSDFFYALLSLVHLYCLAASLSINNSPI